MMVGWLAGWLRWDREHFSPQLLLCHLRDLLFATQHSVYQFIGQRRYLLITFSIETTTGISTQVIGTNQLLDYKAGRPTSQKIECFPNSLTLCFKASEFIQLKATVLPTAVEETGDTRNNRHIFSIFADYTNYHPIIIAPYLSKMEPIFALLHRPCARYLTKVVKNITSSIKIEIFSPQCKKTR